MMLFFLLRLETKKNYTQIQYNFIYFLFHPPPSSLFVNKNFIFKWLCSRSIYCLLICPLSLFFFLAYPRHENQFMRHIVSIIIASHSNWDMVKNSKNSLCVIYIQKSTIQSMLIKFIVVFTLSRYSFIVTVFLLFFASSTMKKVAIEKKSFP